MNDLLRNIMTVAGMAIATQAVAQVTFYEREGFSGEPFTTEKRISNFKRYGFNDSASSVVVIGNRWALMSDAPTDKRQQPETFSIAAVSLARQSRSFGMSPTTSAARSIVSR